MMPKATGLPPMVQIPVRIASFMPLFLRASRMRSL